MNERCLNCGCTEPKVFVHGHTQCCQCHSITDGDCCQGEQMQGDLNDTDTDLQD